MIAGDLVRFKRFENDSEWNIGLLLEYTPYIKLAEILYEGQTLRVHARFVQLHQAGKKGKRRRLGEAEVEGEGSQREPYC